MRKNENGRSMIEMLGVLAIIGVLSVGGVYGYTMAMRKYKANEIAQNISMLATLARAANGGEGDTLTLAQAGLDETVAGIAVSASADGSNNKDPVEVTITSIGDDKVKEAVCAIVPTSSTTKAGYYVTSGCKAAAVGSGSGSGA